ncbi:MAG: flagellar M-ring protein FliF [Planctomycetota bacterium]|jgi:flagellar M-ring protein FliF
MKDIFNKLFDALKSSTPSTRLVIAVGIALVSAIGGYSIWRGANPHMEFFRTKLDNSEMVAVTSALSTAGVRFKLNGEREPYSVWVESGRIYDAHAALAEEGALQSGARGIDTSSGSSAFDSSGERLQKVSARQWQEVAMMLESLRWIDHAKVIASRAEGLNLGRVTPPTVAVTLITKGPAPGPSECKGAANMVINAFHTTPDNVSIIDQHGNSLFDGTKDEELDEFLTFQRNNDRDLQARAQAQLDSTYGPGLALVTVRSEWDFEHSESVDETLSPKGVKLRETKFDSSTPGLPTAGGPAGVQENITVAPPRSAGSSATTRKDTDTQYSIGTRTTHTVQNKPLLTKLHVGLMLDSSLEAQLANAESWVKSMVGFSAEREDTFSGSASPLYGIERDEEGKPLPMIAPEPMEAPNLFLNMVLRHSVEGIAALVFLIVLLRSLKSSHKAAPSKGKGRAGGSSGTGAASGALSGGMGGSPNNFVENDEGQLIEIVPEVLARRQVEELIESDPERVSSLLSRWAMGDDYYAESNA